MYNPYYARVLLVPTISSAKFVTFRQIGLITDQTVLYHILLFPDQSDQG